ncbi:peptide/nickel transport system substrate-binding protein [Pseudochelatococcus lubricantis]|uniref:Peptide/nickel transport system substrate-binding protein n=1 Tax=Pseudochelatococcus lubricantis TaxID=1538102 RepID=A0ABX0UZG2_9HYPH|nr:peptide/nickel transport system substrate-binding protein [Pseudochelatococcus lubricantis]
MTSPVARGGFRRLIGYLAMAALCAFLLSGVQSAMAARSQIVVGVRLEPPHLDPTAGAAAAIGEVTYANVFEGLTRIDGKGEVLPGLAESWDIADDGRTYTFRLREGVQFHDGSSFDAADVKFTLDRAVAADSVNPQKSLLEPIESVEVVDPRTVRIVLRRPTAQFPFTLGLPAAVIVAKETADTNRTNPNGTGPFRVSRWVKGDRIDLERNERYWGAKPALARATFRIIGDPSAAYAALLAGDIDAFPNFPAPENVPQFRADPRFTVVVGNTEGKTVLAINNGRKPLDDIRVRRAIAHAIDRKALIDGAMDGLAQPIGSHYAPQNKGYVDLTGRYPYDPDKARELLKEAGVPELRLRLVLPPPSYARRGGEIIAAQLRAVGIETEIVPVEWAQWLSDVFRDRRYDLSIVAHVEPNDLDIYARDDYYFDYHSPEYKELYAALVAETDDAKRLDILKRIQEKLADDSVNGFLFLLPKIGIWDAKLKGLWENAPIPANDLTGVSWQD